MTTISSDHLALLSATEVGGRAQVWRSGAARGALDEAALVPPWLPTVLDGWEDVGQEVTKVGVRHNGRGATISLTIADEARSNWADDRAIAIVGQAWDGGAWQDPELLAWGYLPGDGTQRLDADGNQSGDRTATYDGYWGRLQVPAHRFGRANLADGASVAGSTSALASVTAEAGLEYISQADNAASKAIDGDADSVYIGDIIADPAQPTLGDDDDVHILRVYNGNTTPVIGAGNEPKFIELCYIKQVATWGAFTSSGAVPNLFDSGSNVRSDGAVVSSITTSGPLGAYYQVRALTGQRDPSVQNGVQWNIGFGLGNRPTMMRLEYKAASSPSIGRNMHVTMKPLDPSASAIYRTLALGPDWQTQDISLDDISSYGGVVLRFQNAKGEVATDDLYFAFRWTMYVGYSDLGFANAHGFAKLHLSYDNGSGVVNTRRIAFDLADGSEDWKIPPLGTIILTDDAKTLRARFNVGTTQVLQLRNLDPDWDFGPGYGKLALRYGNVAGYHIYNPSGFTTIEEIDFSTNGLTWLPTQGLSRQSPIGTGALTVEDYPHAGLLPGAYGGGFIWLDLQPYRATSLSADIASGATSFSVDDPERLAVGQTVVIGSEHFLLTALDDASYTVVGGQDGTTPAAHAAGDAITPRLGGATQTGPQWDGVEIRRKPGTPAIRSGVLIASNLASPGDPSSGGSKWERHPDWFPIARFDNPSKADVISLRPPGGAVQARHVAVGDVLMHRWNGVAQRLKINEIVVREFLPGASQQAGWAGHGASNVAAVAAHLLTQHGGVPAAKVSVTASPAPMGPLPITGAPLAQLLDNLEGDGELQVWLDPHNAVVIAPDPSSPDYDAREAYVTLDNGMSIGGIGVTWGVRQPVAQIRMTAREVAALRTYRIQYPDIPGALGQIVEVKDAIVRSWGEGRDRTQRIWRARNTRRAPHDLVLNPAPWARPYLRCVWNAAGLDASDQVIGVNCCITAYSHDFADDGRGGLIWTTTLTLQEIVL